MVDVFISYAREDREAAKKLAHALEVEGYSVWWDPAIPPGKKWAEVIGTQLGTARCVVVLWSAVSVKKRWVHKEASFADARNKLIPAKLEEVTIPFEFADVQAANLDGWEGDTSHDGFQHLVSAISEQLRSPPSEQTEEDIVVATKNVEDQLAESQGTQGQPIEEKTGKLPIKAAWERFRAYVGLLDRQRLKLMTAVGLFVLVGFAGVITWQQWPPQERTGPGETVKEVPDWVPVYPFAEQENIFLRRGAGSLSFETTNSEQHVSGAYAAKLKAVGWKVETGYDGGYWASGTSPDQQRSVAAIARSAGAKTNVAVSFTDSSLVPSEEAFSPEIVPSWVPVYPGKMENLRYKGHSGGFSVTTTDSEQQVRGLYAAILRASGYEVATGYDGGYYARGTAKSQGRFIAATARTDNNITNILVLFEKQQKQ